jgi:hypothetical protein
MVVLPIFRRVCVWSKSCCWSAASLFPMKRSIVGAGSSVHPMPRQLLRKKSPRHQIWHRQKQKRTAAGGGAAVLIVNVPREEVQYIWRWDFWEERTQQPKNISFAKMRLRPIMHNSYANYHISFIGVEVLLTGACRKRCLIDNTDPTAPKMTSYA